MQRSCSCTKTDPGGEKSEFKWACFATEKFMGRGEESGEKRGVPKALSE